MMLESISLKWMNTEEPMMRIFLENQWAKVEWQKIRAEDISAGNRNILDHASDMTPYLMEKFGSEIIPQVQKKKLVEGEYYARWVNLTKAESSHALLSGVLMVPLENIDECLKEAVLAEKKAFGKILIDLQINHHCEIQYFFKIKGCKCLQPYFPFAVGKWYEGRCTRLIEENSGKILCEVNEIVTLD
jgi:hypothetical protein